MRMLFMALMFVASVAKADDSAKAIYLALDVRAEPTCTQNCPNSVTTVAKTVGGLVCRETTTMSPGMPVTFSCIVGAQLDSQKIFQALSVEAVNACTGRACPNAETTMIKKVGKLRCSVTTRMSPGMPSTYACGLRL